MADHPLNSLDDLLPGAGRRVTRRRLSRGHRTTLTHDLRRTVVTGMNELGVAPHVVEAVVNHVSGRARAGVAGVYNRATYSTEKRVAPQAWADHLDQVLGLGERKVVLLRAERRRETL
jgi:hypothetical protein